MAAPWDRWRERFAVPTVGFPSWSPHRPELLYFVSDEGGSSQGWLLDRAGGRRAQLTDQAVGVESVVVLPDGSGAAWWADDSGNEYGQWMVSDASGAPARPLLPALPGGWSQGLSLAADVVALGLADDAGYQVYVRAGGGPTRLVYSSSSPAGVGREWEQTSGGLSADGRLLCFRHSERGDILHFALRVIDVATGRTVGDLQDDGLTLKVASWSPLAGDQRLALIHERDGIERPAVWHLPSGRRQDFALDLPGPVDVAGWWPDASALLLIHSLHGRSQLYRLDLTTGHPSLLHDPAGWVSAAGVRPDGEVWLREESATRAPTTRTTQGRLVLGPPGPAPAPGEGPLAGRPHRSVVFAGPGGPTHALVATPDGPGPHPAVVMVHGGPEWAYPDDYHPWEQALVDHGYVVLKVNYRGSTGGSVAWRTALHSGNIGFPEVADVVAGLDHFVAEGLVDPGRVAIEGWSWGGYVTLLAAGLHPDRFRAAVAGIPVCDSVMTHEDCSPPQQAYDLAIMGGSPKELPELYAERSPITYVDRVRAPVLLIAGEQDSACPIRQVRHYAARLAEAGGRVQTYVYPAGHHANSIAERVHHAELTLEFLAAHLAPDVPPSSA